MDEVMLKTVFNYVEENYMALIAISLIVWVSLLVLGTLLRAMMRILGWIGSYVFGAIPGAITYAIDSYVFDIQPSEATVQAAVAALLVGLIGQIFGRR